MASQNLDHWAKFRPEHWNVREFRHWIVVVRAQQLTLGSAVFLLKRPVSSLSHMSGGEAEELPEVCDWFETATGRLYQPDRFNYLALMMKDPYVHFHAFPRYEHAREKHTISWFDAAWPRAIELHDVETREDVLLAVRDEMRSA